MRKSARREFIKTSATSTAALLLTPPLLLKNLSLASPNDQVNLAIAGIRSRGAQLVRQFLKIPNVQITTICDVDERLFAPLLKEIETLSGKKAKAVVDFRDVLDDKTVDAVVIATPDHWHALQTIWACRAGKDVYVEKPVSYTIEEGRKMIEAARRYQRVVQVGLQNRSDVVSMAAMKFLHEGKLGEVYMARGVYYGSRESIGRKPDKPIPDGVNWDLFLGPAPYRPFNENRFHYNWHWFWDTGTTDLGNNGVHIMDKARWGMRIQNHPIKVHCAGGYFVYDSDQETPNIQSAIYEYEDGRLVECEIRNLPTNFEHDMVVGNFFYGSEGWMYLASNEFKTFFGSKNEPGPSFSRNDVEIDPLNRAGTGGEPHFQNFIDCVRSRKWQDLNADIAEGHLSTAICHLGNISYRTGRKLAFQPDMERFLNDDEANSYLSRRYRHPYVLPEKI